jgi:hypothetical protein
MIISIIGSILQTILCIVSVHLNDDFFYITIYASQIVNGLLASGSLGK